MATSPIPYITLIEKAIELMHQHNIDLRKASKLLYDNNLKYQEYIGFNNFYRGIWRNLKDNKTRPEFPIIEKLSTPPVKVEKTTTKSTEETERIEDDNGIKLIYKGGKPLTSKEEAIDFFKIDTNAYAIPKFRCNSWTTTMKIDDTQPVQVINYGVELFLEKKATEISLPNLTITKRKLLKSEETKLHWGITPLSDFHAGAYVGDLINTKDFSFDVLCKYLQQIACEINEKQFENVYLPMLGDFIESFTGLNHINSWKGLHKGSYGMNAVILAHEILAEHLYSRIQNLKIVDFAAGNHDRITSNSNEDVFGEAANMLYYLFKKDFPTIESEFSSLVIRRKLDNIGYIGTHGHLGLSKKDTGKIVQDYGFADAEYHVVMQGHYHARESLKSMKKKIAVYEDIKVIQHDSLNYRKITVPPLFTGNFYSESLGYTSTAGGTILFKNKYNRLTHEDITL